MELVMIRHTSVDVPPGTCYGRTDVPLRDSFEAEAEQVKKKLEGFEFDAVYCSPLSRCRRLAAACGMENAIYDDRLLEINFGDWEMQRFEEIRDPRLAEWFEDYFNVPATGGESFADQRRRLCSFIDELRGSGLERVAVFTHGGIIMQTMLMFGLATPEDVFAKQPAYGEVITIKI